MSGTNTFAHLMNDLLNRGYSQFMDNRYIFVEFFSFLLAINTDCIGTLFTEFKETPTDIVTKTLKAAKCIVNYEQKDLNHAYQMEKQERYIYIK